MATATDRIKVIPKYRFVQWLTYNFMGTTQEKLEMISGVSSSNLREDY